MKRRTFLGVTATGAAASALGTSALGTSDRAHAADAAAGAGACFELQRYTVDAAQQEGLVAYLRDAAIPAYNRLDIAPVGVFAPIEETGFVYVLLPHPSAESVLRLTQRLLADPAYLAKGAAFLDAPATASAYGRIESSVLIPFSGMPKVEKPSSAPGRVFQLRIYESPSMKTGQKKIEMFNTAEIAIFRKTGLTPVFFGEAIAGVKLPNLTYMLGFDSAEQRDAAWQVFRDDPEWKALSGKPEYANDRILSGITNIHLTAAECSQI